MMVLFNLQFKQLEFEQIVEWKHSILISISDLKLRIIEISDLDFIFKL